MSDSNNSDNNDFMPLQREGESDFVTAAPTEVSKGNVEASDEYGPSQDEVQGNASGGSSGGSSGGDGGSGDSEDSGTTTQREDLTYEKAEVGQSGGEGPYPLTSEIAQQEREQEAENNNE